MINIYFKKLIRKGFTRVLITSIFTTLVCVGIINAATTIGNNITTNGAITSNGTNTFYGATSIGGALTATSTLGVTGLTTLGNASTTLLSVSSNSYLATTTITASGNSIFLIEKADGADLFKINTHPVLLSGHDVHALISVPEADANSTAFCSVLGTPITDCGANGHHSAIMAVSENTEGVSSAAIYGVTERTVASNNFHNFGIYGKYIDYSDNVNNKNLAAVMGTGEYAGVANYAGLGILAGISGDVVIGGTGAYNNLAGVHARGCKSGVGTATNCYGIIVSDQTVGINNYGIWLNGYGSGSDIVIGANKEAAININNDGDLELNPSNYYSTSTLALKSSQFAHQQIGTYLSQVGANLKLLLGWFSANPASGTEADYSTGANPYPMTYSGFTSTADGYKSLSRILTFDGANSYLTRGSDDAVFDFQTSAFSIGAWVKIPSAGVPANDVDVIIAKMDNASSQRAWEVYLDSAEKLTFVTYDETNDRYCSSVGSTLLTPGQWYFISVTKASGGSGGTFCSANVELYINGVGETEDTTDKDMTGTDVMRDVTAPLTIGYADDPWVTNGSNKEYFSGAMGQLFVLNGTDLSDSQIWTLYELTRGYYGQ